MSFLTILLSPINLFFAILIAGFTIGRIRIHKATLGISGILFVSIFIGAMISIFVPDTHGQHISDIQSAMKTFSTLGSSLFVSVIGLQTGFSLKGNSKSSIASFAVGASMSLSGVIVMLLISTLDSTTNLSTLLGILCGALTSTPGLSSVCELLGDDADNAVIGYSHAYFCGVLLAVIFSQILTRNNEKNDSKTIASNRNSNKLYLELVLIINAALLGSIFDKMCSDILNMAIGNTAFTLLFGLIIGYVVQKTEKDEKTSSQVLNSFKNLGLAMFFAGTGFTTGLQSLNFEARAVIYGIVITLSAILFGLIICKLILHNYSLDTGFVVAGGMTSSPAYGAIGSKANENSINHFSFAYFGALIALIIAMQIVGRQL